MNSPITSDAELVRKLAREHLHSAFDPLPNNKNKLDYSLIENKQIEKITVGDIALMLKKAGRIPKGDRDKIDILLGNNVPIPKNQGMKHIKNLFESLSLSVSFSDRFLDIFRSTCIKASIQASPKHSSVIQIRSSLNQNW